MFIGTTQTTQNNKIAAITVKMGKTDFMQQT
jgi:hypothetical protein